eukprot:15470981-Alexandrium_andersonii.AAC.1
MADCGLRQIGALPGLGRIAAWHFGCLAMWICQNIQNGFRRSKLELRGPRKCLGIPLSEASSGGFGVTLRAESD